MRHFCPAFSVATAAGTRFGAAEEDIVERDDLWSTGSKLHKPRGRAAIVVPGNVLFEGGIGEIGLDLDASLEQFRLIEADPTQGNERGD